MTLPSVAAYRSPTTSPTRCCQLTTSHRPLREYTEILAPLAAHLHIVDGKGVDGEGVQIDEGDVNWPELAEQLDRLAPGVSFIPEIWMGHVNNGEGFWTGLDRLEKYL